LLHDYFGAGLHFSQNGVNVAGELCFCDANRHSVNDYTGNFSLLSSVSRRHRRNLNGRLGDGLVSDGDGADATRTPNASAIGDMPGRASWSDQTN